MEKGNKIILIMGILIILAGVGVKYEASSFLKKAVPVEGKVVYVLGSSYKVQYFTNDGLEKIKQGSGKSHGFREGNSVPVWYTRDNPDMARLSDGKKTVRTLFIAGIISFILGIYPLFQKRKS